MVRIALVVSVTACSSSPSSGPTAPAPEPAPVVAAETPADSTRISGSCTAEEGGDSFGAMSNERFGQLRLGADADVVTSTLGEPESVSGPVANEAEGTMNWSWKYPAQGLEVEIGAEDRNAPKRVSAIMVGPGSSLKTRFGIGVGSPVDDVERAYGPCLSREESSPETLIAGTIYGGVFFSIEDGAVRAIFVGAGAE